MKKLLMLIICAAAYFTYLHFKGGKSSEALAMYEEFMDHWIVMDYAAALNYTTGQATAKVEPQTRIHSAALNRTIDTPAGGYGDAEDSKNRHQGKRR